MLRLEAGETPKYWTYAEVTLIRATGMLHVVAAAFGLVAPARLTDPFGIVVAEPATFLRALFAMYGVLGLGLLRAVGTDRGRGRLLVETISLTKIALFAVIVVEAVAHRQPPSAAIALLGDLAFGVALLRASRRTIA